MNLLFFSSAIIRCCCPCCLRGEQDEKRVKVTYDKPNSPLHAEEKESLLKPEEQPEDTVKENGDTEKEDAQDTPEPDHNDNKEDEGETMKGDGEVTEDTDEHSRKEMETVTTTTTRTTSGGEESPKNLTREILEKTHDKQEKGKDGDTEVIEYVDKHGRRIRRIVKKTVTTTVVKTRGLKGDDSNTVTTESGEHGSEKLLINFGKAGLQRSSEEQTTIQAESKPSDNYLEFKRTSISRLIGGDENRSADERSTTTSGRDGEHPIVIVKKDRPQIDTPEWMEERKSPGAQRRILENSDISVHLKYPRDNALEKNEPEEKANESTIQPDVAKRDKPDISILDLEEAVKEKEKDQQPASTVEDEEEEEDDDDDDDDDDDEEEEEGEYDEFEEEFVVMEVSRNPRFPKGLEIPEPEPEKVGIPIEDLLEIPTLQVEQNSAPDDGLSVEEKIESEERNRVVFSELPINFEMFEKL